MGECCKFFNGFTPRYCYGRKHGCNGGPFKNKNINYNKKLDYHTIVGMVKAGSNVITIKNSHAREKIKKQVIIPKVLWNNGTYIRKQHGDLRKNK